MFAAYQQQLLYPHSHLALKVYRPFLDHRSCSFPGAHHEHCFSCHRQSWYLLVGSGQGFLVIEKLSSEHTRTSKVQAEARTLWLYGLMVKWVGRNRFQKGDWLSLKGCTWRFFFLLYSSSSLQNLQWKMTKLCANLHPTLLPSSPEVEPGTDFSLS